MWLSRSFIGALLGALCLGLDADKALVAQLPGIDVVVGDKTRRVMDTPEWIGQTPVIQVGYGGEWLGRLNLAREAGQALKAEFQILNMRPDVADDPELVGLLSRYRALYPEPTRSAE